MCPNTYFSSVTRIYKLGSLFLVLFSVAAAWIMGSQEGCSDRNGATRTRDTLPNPLTRQESFYGLTFDEVQNQLGDLGKPLGSMNLDELLKTLLAAESCSQAKGQPVPSSSNLVMLSGDLSKKTVDEVWLDIQQGHKKNFLDREATLGDMMLEDFLVKAGVVTEQRKELGPAQTPGLPQQQAQWMNYHQVPSSIFVPSHHRVPMDGVNYSDNQMTVASSSALMGNLTGTQATGRKRVAPNDVAEKSSERRQKRMIKNRESAARSRARNQAYTQELENKVARLEEENRRLKGQKELENIFPSIPPPEPKYQLRRTSSAPM